MFDIFQAVELVRMESCPPQVVLPLVGLAADKITRDGYSPSRMAKERPDYEPI
ncbi:MAG: hypothetical protein ACODAD_09175 [Planctomycetota bacterium]